MMKKFVLVSCVLALLTTPWVTPTHAKPGKERPTKNVVDFDQDGYNNKRDCNDLDDSIYPGAPEATCGDPVDRNCDGIVGPDCTLSCTDADSDGYSLEGNGCGPMDCNDSDGTIYPGAFEETCGDVVDRNCDGFVESVCLPTCTDADGDTFAVEGGECGPADCNDNNSYINPDAIEICGDPDLNCDEVAGPVCTPLCTDVDEDGYAIEGGDCGSIDCNDNDISVYPGATENCGDEIDQNCSGADLACSGGDGPHDALTYLASSGKPGYPDNCISCHDVEADDMFDSTHYQWVGTPTDMVNDPGDLQGKLTNAMNSYCINIEGDWPVCGSCHIGRGERPDTAGVGVENIDCLACHNQEYATARIRLADGSMGVASPSDTMVRNIEAPSRVNCLKCHATAGGGDGVKRGDLSIETGINSDPDFDVHMNTSGADLSCQSCHVFENHKVIGKGSDLRPTDDLARGSEIQCITCHSSKDSLDGHENRDIGRHVARVACQTCHIPTYAKVETEIYRDWRSHPGGASGPGHPLTVKEGNLIPEYKFWNRLSDNALLHDDASATYDPALGTYPTSRPMGDIEDGMLYPFKYKTATQPMVSNTNVLIALDTYEYIKVSGDIEIAIQNGLENMGYDWDEAYEWIDTDTYQLLNHGINPAISALQCASCHGSTNRIDLQNEIGYGLKGAESDVCTQCHGDKGKKSFEAIHSKHVKDKKIDCSRCHTFSRPERNLDQE